MSHVIFDDLFRTILSRKGADAGESYTASLFAKGRSKIAQKVGEEAVETCIEALQGDTEKLAAESADLLFHLMVLWADADITPDDVFKILTARQHTSGHAEKASRRE
jgi:phosphoribosyl-ATP pyrophosphohydrolase